jgi:diguanylate cyclase (GGDEF)-like protein/PAS domain S-box-containing protein
MTDNISPPLFAVLLEHSREAALVIDQYCVIRFANPAFERLSGHKITELIGQPLTPLLPDSIAEEHGDLVRQYCQEPGHSAVLGRIRELSLRHRDDHLIPVELKAVDLGIDNDERFLGAFMTDLRPRQALEAENRTLLARLEQEALTDTLTGLPNRRAFDAEAVRAMARAQRDGSRALLAILDIDHFKDINDRYGHAVGDIVLKTLARSLQVSMRVADFVARIGGEEFGWLLPNITTEQAVPAVERIRQAVAATEIGAAGRPGISVTISAGLTLLDPAVPLTVSFERANSALRKAKDQGRNRLVVH